MLLLDEVVCEGCCCEFVGFSVFVDVVLCVCIFDLNDLVIL